MMQSRESTSRVAGDSVATGELRISTMQLAESVERAPVGIAHFDDTGRFELVNPQLCAIFGLSREQLLAKTFHEISFPDDLPRCLELTALLGAGKLPRYTLEKRFHRPDGSFVYVRVIVSVVRDAGGKVEYFIGIVEDLSEQWTLEQARRAAEERLQLALEASGTGIYRYDFAARALDWSSGLAEVFGFPKGEPLQSLENLLSAIHPEDLGKVLAAYQASLTDGADFDQEFRIILPGGRIRWISDRARMSLDEQGNARYLTGACIDVTDRCEAEQERLRMLDREQEARRVAEHAIRHREEVLAVVAHDLRNPVHTILMSAGAMLELPLTAAEHQQQLALVRKSARGMDHLIQDLLDVTRIENGKLAVDPVPTELGALVEEVVAIHRPRADERNLRLESHMTVQRLNVMADRDRIAQVLGNLIGNAIKFTEPAGSIAIRCARLDGEVQVSVQDTGRGIPAESLDRMFEPYWQEDRKSTQGVGLGLAIVRGIVAAHGGRISAQSRVGEGTTFTFTLPEAGR